MKFILIVFPLLFISLIAQSQRPSADRIETSKGPLTIQPILHGTLMMHWDNKTIYVDPYGGAKVFEGIQAPQLILITDIHGDHMNIETLESINTSEATIVAPQAVADLLPDALKKKLVILKNGENTTFSSIGIKAIPMYNLPESPDSRHTKGRGNGYILEMGGKNIYLSGDTEDIEEMRALKNIDVAFLCMNQPFTMSVDQAVSAALAFKPKIVYPYHYRGREGLSDVESFRKRVLEGNNKIDVRLRNWYP